MTPRSIIPTLLIALLLSHGPACAEPTPAEAPTAAKPRVLIYSAFDSEYVADTLPFWGNTVGVNGFILSYIANWWSSKNELAVHAQTLKQINTQGKQYAIDSNFINVGLGYQELPLWTDDKAWADVINHFKDVAELIKITGTKGIALDTEPYSSALFDSNASRFSTIPRKVLKAKIYQRGKEIMQALVSVYPNIEVIILPEGALYWFNADGEKLGNYELWIDFFNGMASVKNSSGIVIGGEATYSITNRFTLNRIFTQFDETMLVQTEDPRFWKEQCAFAMGMWPLGKEYDNKAARMSPAEFEKQFEQAVSLSNRYVWIYDHGSSWFQVKPGDMKKYTRDGRAVWGKDYQVLPTSPSVDAYYTVLRNYKKGL